MGAAGSRLLPQLELPKLLSAALNRLCAAVADDDANPELLETVARAADTPTERARLARAVIARAEAEAIDEKLADAQVLVEDWRLDLELWDSEHPTRQSAQGAGL